MTLKPLTLKPLTLKKDAEQLGLFGDVSPVGLTPRAKRRETLQRRGGQQMSLFPEQGQTSGPAPAAVKGRRARKGGEFIAGKRYAGGQWIPKAAFEAQEQGKQYSPQSTPQQPVQKLQVIEDEPVTTPQDDPVTVREAQPVDPGYAIPPEPEAVVPSIPTDGGVPNVPSKPTPSPTPEGGTPAARDWQQKMDALRDRLTGGIRPRGVSAKVVKEALDHLDEQIKTSEGARSYLDRYSALDDGAAVADLVTTYRAVMRLDRSIADRKKEAEVVSRQDATAIAGKAEQVVGGRSEKAIADFIHQAGLDTKLFADKEFAVTLKNPPYEDLAIERQGDLIMFTHYYDQNGDRVPDGEIAFRLFPNGQLKLAYTASHYQGREYRGLDKKFAGVMARNIVAQGFHESPSLGAEAKPDTSHLSSLEVNLSNERARLDNATTDGEKQHRQVWVNQLEREVAAEKKHLGIDGGEVEGGDRLSDEDLLAELGVDPTSTPVEPAAVDGAEPVAGVDVEYAAVSGAKQRQRANSAALDLLAQDKTEYTPEELVTLAQYSGKGGLGKDTESINEYYTRSDVAAHTVAQLRAAGFSGGSVLEPSCGTGVFLHSFKGDDTVLPIGVDISKDSSAIAAALNPHADVSHARFERFLLDNPDTQLDGITGNIPFGPCQMTGDDNDLAASAAFRDKYKTAEALFLNEGMKRLKPGGVMSVIVPHGVTSGSQHQKLRAELCKHGRVVGVQRLPGEAFEHTGTATVTDVLVMQRHPDHILDAIARGDKDTLLAVTDSGFIGGSYFDDNPDHVLGQIKETTNQWGGKAFVVEGSTEAALNRAKAQTFTPTVTYEGLEGVAATPDQGVAIGSTKSVNGRQYRFEGDPPRWHRVDDQPSEPVSLNAEDYGHDTLAAVHEAIQDVGKRIAISPDHLENYVNLAKSDSLLHGSDLEGLKAAHATLNSGKPAERGKIIHAMVLAHHLKELQNAGADGAAIRQGLGLLLDYKEKHGSAAGDRTLTRLALEHPALLALQGAFKDDGGISDYWANPTALKNQEERVADTAAAAAGEAYRAYGATPVDLAQVREFFPSDLPDDEFKSKVLADPSIGYSGGRYMPIQQLLKGDGYELIDDLQSQQDECAVGSSEHRKFQEQIDLARDKMNLRTFEDLPVNIWNVGSWIPVQAFNEFCGTMGVPLQVEATEDGKFESTRFVEDKKNKLNQGLLAALNGQKIRANVTAEKGYLMKDALKDFQADFKDWLASTPYREEIEDTYNRAFNGRLETEYSGDPLDIEGFDQPGGKRLHDYQCSTIRQMAEQGRGIISLGVGLGKAQPLDAKVLTPTGWKLMGDIQVGDKVINSQGAVSRVTGVFPQGEKDIYEVVFKDGSATECCDEHLWAVWESHDLSRGKPLRKMELREIVDAGVLRKAGNHLASKWAIPSVKPIDFPKQELPVDPYLLGALLGDGRLPSENNRNIIFSSADEEMISMLGMLLPENLHFVKAVGDNCDWRISKIKTHQKGLQGTLPNSLTNAIFCLGLYGARSHNKFIPDAYKFAPTEARIAVLQGLMDTDGSTWKVKRGATTLEFTSISKRLADDIVFIVQSLGGMAVVESRTTSYTHHGEIRQGQVSYRVRPKLPASIQPFRLSRKALIYVPPSKYPPVRFMKEVNYVGRKPAQCISVDAPDHLYVTDDCIVTHNTASAIALAMHLKEQGRCKKNGIIVPKSVLANWVKEIKFWAPDASVMVLGMSQQYWQDGTEAYEVPGYQMAMVGDKPQTFRNGTPKLKLVGDLKGMVIATAGRGKAESYTTDEQGNYLLYSEEDAEKSAKEREYTAISPEDLQANSVPLYGGGENQPEKDEAGNYIMFADGDRDRQTPIPFSDGQLKKDGILSMVSDDAATKERKMQQTAQNAFDVVLMSEPVFQRINLSPEKYQDYVKDTVTRHINPEGGFAKDLSIRAAKRMSNEGPTEGDVRENSAGNLEEFRDGRWHRVSADDEKRGYAKLKQQEQKMGELVGRQGRKTSNIYWESLGIDNLIADEAHHYKNLFAPHRAESDIAYLSTAQSNRSLDFYFKAKHTLETNNSQNCYLLTATPTSNNPLEIYNMLVHIAPDELDSRGIHNIDQFLDHFGKVEEVDTLNLKLEATRKTGLVGFQALRDLRKLTKQYVRIESAKSLQEKGNTTFRQPKKNQQIHSVKLTPQQQAVYAHVRERLDELQKKREAGEEHQEGDDHTFSCISDMDKIALDVEHYANNRSEHGLEIDLSAPGATRSPKIEATVEQVMASRQANEGKQIIFCDAVTMHQSLKASLVAAGYPEDEIVIVNAKEMPTATDRLRISQAYNSGQISLVIGNTATMGEGMNFQVGTTDIHHLNLPWTPKDIEQRDGRGVRQGNALESVGVHYYLAEESLDEYRQDNLARKEGAFDELWNGNADEASNLEAEMDQDTERLIETLSAQDPAEAKRRIEQQKAEAEAKRKADGAKSAFRQFESLQNKMKLYQGLSGDERLGEKGRGMLADINRSKARLMSNEFFEHKALLDSPEPVYIHKNRRLGVTQTLAVGDHVRDGHVGSSGKIYKITGIDLSKRSLKAIEVAKTSNYDPVTYNPGAEVELPLSRFAASDEELEEKFSKTKGRGWDKSQAQAKYFSPINYNDDIHRDRILEHSPDYQGLRSLDSTWVDANREQVLAAISKKWGQSYSSKKFVTYSEFDGYTVQPLPKAPEGAQVILPGDGEHIESLLRAAAKADAESDYSVKSTLVSAIEELTGISPNRAGEMQNRYQAYVREQVAAVDSSGPVEGQTRVNRAGHLEVLRGGRWVLANPSEYTPDDAYKLAQGAMDEGTWEKFYRKDEVASAVARALYYAGSGSNGALEGLQEKLEDLLRYSYTYFGGKEEMATVIRDLVDEAKAIAQGPPEGAEAEAEPTPPTASPVPPAPSGSDSLVDSLVGAISSNERLAGMIREPSNSLGNIVGVLSSELDTVGADLMGSGQISLDQFSRLANMGGDARRLLTEQVADQVRRGVGSGNEKESDPPQDYPGAGVAASVINGELASTPEHLRRSLITDLSSVVQKYGRVPNLQNDIASQIELRNQIWLKLEDSGLIDDGNLDSLADRIVAGIVIEYQNNSAGSGAPQPEPQPKEMGTGDIRRDPDAPLENHPDPIGAIEKALGTLAAEDPDGAAEVNGVGFNKFHTPYRGGVVGNPFVASLVERIKDGLPLSDKQLQGALDVVTTYRKRLGNDHGLVLPTLEQLNGAIAERPTPKPAKKPVEQKSQREVAQDIVAALNAATDHHDYEPVLWERRGMRVYLNDRDGGRGTGPGYIEIMPDKTIVNNSSLEDSHPVFQIAAPESLGFKAPEKVSLPENPTRKQYASYLAQALNDAPDVGGLKSALWATPDGKKVRVYINSPGSRKGPSGQSEWLEIGANGFTDKTSLPSDHPFLLTARQIESDVLSQTQLQKTGRRYTLAGVPYVLRRTGTIANLVKVQNALLG